MLRQFNYSPYHAEIDDEWQEEADEFSFSDVFRYIRRLPGLGSESRTIRQAIARGIRDENKLTNMVFFARHPERKGRRIGRSEPNFRQLSQEWLSIRNRKVRPALAASGTAVTPPVTGKCSRSSRSPSNWARGKLTKMMRWWNGEVGRTLREMTPKVFPGAPVEAIVGFCANGSVKENTTEGVARQKFHEIGLFGTEAGPRNGPAPNPNPKAEDNSWGKLARHPLVMRLLGGRPATMRHNAWKRAIPDQVAIGLVNVRRHGENVARKLDPSIRPDVAASSSLFFVACCFMGWSAGDTGAARHLNRFKDALSRVPEHKRWGVFLREVANNIESGRLDLRGCRKHTNVAYSIQRTWQKLAAGQLLAARTGGRVKWFDTGLGNDEARVVEVITCAGNIARATPRRMKCRDRRQNIGPSSPSGNATSTIPHPGQFKAVPVEYPGGGRITNKKDPQPSDLVTVKGYGGRSIQLHRLAAKAWQALVAAARADGISHPLLLPTSGYRSSQRQAVLWRRALEKYGSRRVTRKWVAPPGGSAHQSGRAIDFYLGGRNSSSNVGRLRQLPAYRWLLSNAQRFGFYPYKNEPWHWEYNPPAQVREAEYEMEHGC